MTKRRNKTELARFAPGFAAEGRRVPGAVVRRHLSDARNAIVKELRTRTAFELDAARHAKAMNSLPAQSEAQRRRFRQLSRSRRKAFASRVLAVPPVLAEPFGVQIYTVNLTPTYAFAGIDGDLAGPGNSSFARRSTGEMELRFSNSLNDNRFYFSLVELGGFFFPTQGASQITARVNPSVAFSWYVDSHGPRAFSDGFVTLTVVGFKGTKKQGERRSFIELWRENLDLGSHAFSFEVRPAALMPMSTSLTLNGSDFYLITFRCISVFATGSDGTDDPFAFTIGSIRASLPAITVDVKVEPVASQG
jgi:hypothetical protein